MPIVDRTRETIENKAKTLLQISDEYREGKIEIEYLVKTREAFVKAIQQNPIQAAIWILKGVESEEVEKANRKRDS